MPDGQSIPVVNYRPIPGCPGYRVGDDGSVWSNRRGDDWRPLKLSLQRSRKTTYHVVKLPAAGPGGKLRKCRVHRLVLEAFVGSCPEGMEACHDPNPDGRDNRLCNLRWGTRVENVRDAQRAKRYPVGEQRPGAKLSDDDVRDILRLNAEGWGYNRLARRYSVSRGAIQHIIRRRSWAHVT